MIKTSIEPLQLAVCSLNISEGRNHKIVESIAKACVSNQGLWKNDNNVGGSNINMNDAKCKAAVLSVYTDNAYNRGNITIAAPVGYLSTSVYQASIAAFQTIDLHRHLNPGHPRLGVVDLIPIHPISSSVSLKMCGIVARNIAERIVTNIKGTSVFLFGHADLHKRGLVQRRKEINWYEMKSDINVLSTPDMGQLTATSGVTGVGAIPYMTVLNMILHTDDLLIGKKIAAKLRGSNVSTGLPGIQTMAFRKAEGVEIACNIDTNDLQSQLPVFMTSFEDLENAISENAAEYNVKILKKNIRGFSPHEAYSMASHALGTGESSPWKLKDITMM